MPAGECPDSPDSSAGRHSNESNSLNDAREHMNNLQGTGNYLTDGEVEYVGDSEGFADNDLDDQADMPNYEELLAEQSRLLEDYPMTNNVHIHPNYYLPLNSSFTSANSAELERPQEEIWPPPPAYANEGADTNVSDSSHTTSSEDDNDSVLHYGFPVNSSNINRLSAAFTTDSEMMEGGYSRGSVIDDMSDISGLCEIEDSDNLSESDDENTPLQSQKIHTEV